MFKERALLGQIEKSGSSVTAKFSEHKRGQFEFQLEIFLIDG